MRKDDQVNTGVVTLEKLIPTGEAERLTEQPEHTFDRHDSSCLLFDPASLRTTQQPDKT